MTDIENIINFNEFNFDLKILDALNELNYQKPTPIQEKSISHILDGKDVLGLAQTGTGKTAAFVLPILQQILENPLSIDVGSPRAVILVPNRELCQQIVSATNGFAKNLNIGSFGLFGGLEKDFILSELEKCPDILVATPGKLLEYLTAGIINLKKLNFFVLDEVDRMIDVDSIYEIKKIIKTLPKKRQSLFFSATLNEKLDEIVESILNPNYVRVEINQNKVDTSKIEQNLFYVAKDNKFRLLLDVLNKKEVKSAIIFVNSRKGGDNLVRFLSNNNIKSEALHGQKSDVHRDKVLKNINTKETKYLVATDLGSRGLDISNISAVINFDLPNNPEVYVHRIGRTARAGASGLSFSFCSPEEKHFLNQIEDFTKQNLIENKHQFHLEKAKKVTGSDAKPKFKNKKDNKNKGKSNTVFRVSIDDILKQKNQNKKKKRKSNL